MKRLAHVFVAMALSLLMTGCGDSGGSGSSGPTTAVPPAEDTGPPPKGGNTKIKTPTGPKNPANPNGPDKER